MSVLEGSEMAEKLSWVYCPRLEDGDKFRKVLGIIFFLASAWLISGGTFIESITIVFLLLIALGPAVWDQSFEIEGSRLKVCSGLFFQKRIDLRNMVRAIETEKGVFLSPYKKASRLDSFHGAFLPYVDGKKDSLTRILKGYVVLNG